MDRSIIHNERNGAPCWDTFGMCTSGLCAVHCAALPLMLGLLPAAAGQWLHGPLVHALLAVAVLSFCILGIVPRYLQHRQPLILAGMVVGLSLVLFATFCADWLLGEAFAVPIISVGNAILIATHWCNRRLGRSKQACR